MPDMTDGRLDADARAQIPHADFLHYPHLPVEDEAHWRAAAGRIDETADLTADEKAAAHAKWRRIGQDKGWLHTEAHTDSHLEAIFARLFAEHMAAIGGTRADGSPIPFNDVMTDDVADVWEVIEDHAGTLRLRLRITRANTRNDNQRVYPTAILADSVQRLQRRILSHGPVFMLDAHPETIVRNGRAVGFREDAALRVATIDRAFMDSDGWAYYDVTFLDTVRGRALADRYRKGDKLSVSLRALGNSRRGLVNGKRTAIATYMDNHGADFVSRPAMAEAGPVEVLTDSQISDLLTDEDDTMPKAAIEALRAQIAELTATAATLGGAMTDAAAPTAPAVDVAALNASIAKMQKMLDDADAMDDSAATAKKKADYENSAKDKAEDEAGAKAMADMRDSLKSLTGLVNSLTDASAKRDAADAATAARRDVSTFVDSLPASEALARFPKTVRDRIVSQVGAAPTRADADRVLAEAIAMTDSLLADEGLKARGFGAETTSEKGKATPGLEVSGGDRPHIQIVKNFCDAFDAFGRMSSTPKMSREFRNINQPFVDQIEAQWLGQSGKHWQKDTFGAALLDNANAFATGAFTDSTTTADIYNQPVLLTVILRQIWWNLEMAQYLESIGPGGFDRTQTSGKTGPVLRLPVQAPVLPAGTDPGFNDPGMFSDESQAIPFMNAQLTWLDFFPNFRRLGFELTEETRTGLQNGPLNYDAWAALLYEVTQNLARTKDNAALYEMLLTSSEYNAVAVTGENPVAVPSASYNAGGNAKAVFANQFGVTTTIQYGATVILAVPLACGGSTAAPNYNVPIVKQRRTRSITAAGQLSAWSSLHAVTQGTINSVPQVEGYLNGTNDIVSKPGTTATFAVDYEHGFVVYNTASGANNSTHLPNAINYTYERNYDCFQVSGLALGGLSMEEYLNSLLRQIDGTAAGMAKYPNSMPPDLLLMPNTSAMAYITPAKMFYQYASPKGTELINPEVKGDALFGRRSGINYAKHNNPYQNDNRILLTSRGSTKHGVDVPAEIDGPHQKVDVAGGTGLPIDAKFAFIRENSLYATPLRQKQDGTILNNPSRTIRLI